MFTDLGHDFGLCNGIDLESVIPGAAVEDEFGVVGARDDLPVDVQVGRQRRREGALTVNGKGPRVKHVTITWQNGNVCQTHG